MLRTESIQFSYKPSGGFNFTDVSLLPGDECLLLGASGSGKTTLLHLIGGLLKCHQGAITINDTELTALSERELDTFRGNHIGFIFQKHHLISALSVQENLTMPGYLNRRSISASQLNETLELLDLSAFAKVNVKALSHGQMQRVAIARAIMNKPYVLLADEPTSALDDENCDRVMALLRNVVRMHRSILLIATHDHRLKTVITKQVNLHK